MREWAQKRITRILCLVGIIGLVLMDLGQAIPSLHNGWFGLEGIKAFHIGLWMAWIAFAGILMRSE